jgi:hypothetical protein
LLGWKVRFMLGTPRAKVLAKTRMWDEGSRALYVALRQYVNRAGASREFRAATSKVVDNRDELS